MNILYEKILNSIDDVAKLNQKVIYSVDADKLDSIIK